MRLRRSAPSARPKRSQPTCLTLPTTRLWIGGISEAEPLGAIPMSVGSRVRRRASFLGRRIDYVMEVVALDPGRRLVMHAVEAPMPMDVTYEVDSAPDGAVA